MGRFRIINAESGFAIDAIVDFVSTDKIEQFISNKWAVPAEPSAKKETAVELAAAPEKPKPVEVVATPVVEAMPAAKPKIETRRKPKPSRKPR